MFIIMIFYLKQINDLLSFWLWNIHPKFSSISLLLICISPIILHVINLIKFYNSNMTQLNKSVLIVDTICRIPKSINIIVFMFFPINNLNFDNLFFINGIIFAYQIIRNYQYATKYNTTLLCTLISLKILEIFFGILSLPLLKVIFHNISIYILGIYVLNLIKNKN